MSAEAASMSIRSGIRRQPRSSAPVFGQTTIMRRLAALLILKRDALELAQLLDLDAIQHHVHPIQPLLNAVEIHLTQRHGAIQVSLMLGHHPLYFRLLPGHELVIDRDFGAGRTGQHSGHGQRLLGAAGNLAKDGPGTIRNPMGQRQIAVLILAVQGQRECAKCDPIEGFAVHDVLPSMRIGRVG